MKAKISGILKNLEVFLTKTNSQGVLKSNVEYVDWMEKKAKLGQRKGPKQVFQKNIYWCDFGFNVGSEESKHRPCVVIQNNIGNKKLKTTVVVPVTSYQNCEIISSNNENYIIHTDQNGNAIGGRKLNFTEIPLQTLKGNTVGIANITHIRSISPKRLKSDPCDQITSKCLNNIKNAIQKNFL